MDTRHSMTSIDSCNWNFIHTVLPRTRQSLVRKKDIMHPGPIAEIDRMARRTPIDILVKGDVVQRRAPVFVVAHADVVVSVRGSVGWPREYDYGLCGWVDADA